MTKSAGDALIQLETIKLLLQVAWADLSVHRAEAQLILERALQLGLPEPSLRVLRAHLRGEQPLPPPDMQLLRARKAAVLEAARELVLADRRVTSEEKEILAQIASALEGG